MAEENFKNLHSIKIKQDFLLPCQIKKPEINVWGKFFTYVSSYEGFFLILMWFCASFITFYKGTSFPLGFHSAGINSNDSKKSSCPFLTLGLEGAECSFNMDEVFYLPK